VSGTARISRVGHCADHNLFHAMILIDGHPSLVKLRRAEALPTLKLSLKPDT